MSEKLETAEEFAERFSGSSEYEIAEMIRERDEAVRRDERRRLGIRITGEASSSSGGSGSERRS